MKRKICSVLILCFSVLLAGCNDKGVPETTTENITAAESTTAEAAIEEKTTIPPAQGLETEETTVETTPGNADITSRIFYGEKTGTDKTMTGFEPLEKRDFILSDAEKLSTFPSTLREHSYGAAADEKPHNISVTNQQFFNEKGFDAICLDTKSEEKVLYLTFDCGYENGYTSKILDVLKEKGITAAFFCTLPQVRDNKELIARMINEGHIVGNHSVSHPDFSALSAEKIIEEVKGFDDYMRENFGYSSLYFRYPQGKYSERSTAVLNELGFKCIFWSLAYADWDIENQKGALYAYETVLSRIHPGAVILLHSVSSDNAGALSDIIDTAVSKGYAFKSLEDIR